MYSLRSTEGWVKRRESLCLKFDSSWSSLHANPWTQLPDWPVKGGGRWRGQWVHTVVQISIQLDICNIKLPTFYPPYYTFRDRLMQRCSTRQGNGNRKRMKKRKYKGKRKTNCRRRKRWEQVQSMWRSEGVKWRRKNTHRHIHTQHYVRNLHTTN